MITIISLIFSDWKRYLKIHKNPTIVTFFLTFFHNPGMFFSLLFRTESWLYHNKYFKYLGYLLYPFYFIITYFFLDVDIPPTAKIDEGLYIHNKGVVFTDARSGKNLTLIGPLTVGRNLGDNSSPVLGNNVTICTGARIIGKIKIGNNVIVGANAVVISHIPDNVIIGGIPAKVLKKLKDSELKHYILN